MSLNNTNQTKPNPPGTHYKLGWQMQHGIRKLTFTCPLSLLILSMNDYILKIITQMDARSNKVQNLFTQLFCKDFSVNKRRKSASSEF